MPEKNAVVLSGGSVKGAFQAGALPVVFRKGFVPDALFGVSVGSLNAAFLCDRVGRQVRKGRPVDWVAAAVELEEFWETRINQPSDIARKRPLGGLFDAAFHHFESLMNPSPLRKMLAQELDPTNVAACPANLYVSVTQLEDGRTHTVGKGVPDLADWVLASSMIPVVLPPIEIASRHYVDGGAREVAPLRPAIDHGAERIVAVLCQARDPAPYTVDGRLVAYTERLMDIAVNALVNDDLARCEQINATLPLPPGKRKIALTVVRPDVQPTFDLQSFDRQDILDLIAVGRATANQVFP